MNIRNEHVVELRRADKCLYFDIDGENYCLAPWSMDLGWSVHAWGRWMPLQRDPGFRLLREEPHKPGEPLNEFLGQIPAEVQAAARPFRYLQHTVLRLMRLTAYAFDLAHSNPVLLWLIADVVSARGIRLGQAVALMRGKQKAALAALCPENRALSARFMRKIRPTNFCEEEFETLKEVLAEEALVRCLRHFRRVNLGALVLFPLNPNILGQPSIRQDIEAERFSAPQGGR